MSWLIRVSQSLGVTQIIEGVCNNTMDINNASNQIALIGFSACDEINARASIDVANQPKMRKLLIAAGCQGVFPPVNQDLDNGTDSSLLPENQNELQDTSATNIV